MNCRKCGARNITRRAAGYFSCNHCGVAPGPEHRDRSGHFTPPALDIATSDSESIHYEFAPLQRRLVANYKPQELPHAKPKP